ncbi:MAG: multiple monosaccharide ABC transporter ATP-binding protein [Mycobacteriales bacterium]
MAAPLILEMRDISKSFPGVKALEHVTLEVRQGEIHAICGENGAGKSTLIKVLGGIYPHGSYEGDIVYNGEEVAFKDIRGSEARGIVIIHQELALIPQLSIAENIFLGNEHSTRGVISWNETSKHAAALLRRVGLHENPETRIADLGVGKQQLVEIAKALSKKVELLILDEPTAALNEEDSQKLLGLILELKANGIASVIISHKLNEVAQVADAITILRDGRTIETIRVAKGEVIDEDRIIRGMVGRDLAHRFPERTSTPGETLFAVKNWTVYHPLDQTRKVVDDVSLHVRRGEIVGLAGLIGAGRTELCMSVFGRSYGTHISGQVFKGDKEIHLRTVSDAIKHGIAYVTEDRKRYGLHLIDTISRNVSLAALRKVSEKFVISEREEATSAEGFRKQMNIKARDVATIVGTLSGGNQQKVVLSKWIFTDPDILIIDEPTRGIDIGAKSEIYGILNQLAADEKAVLFISSELPELLGVCDRIYVLSEGRLTGELSRKDATQESLMKLMTMDRGASNVNNVA